MRLDNWRDDEEAGMVMADLDAEEGSFRCAECDAEFPSREALGAHGRHAHGSGMMAAISGQRCDACGAEFDGVEALEEHREQAHASAA